MAQKSSKQQAEEAVLDLKGKLRQLNNALAGKGATIAENAPLVATIKAVEGMTAGGGGGDSVGHVVVNKNQQFDNYPEPTMPKIRFATTSAYYLFWRSALTALPKMERTEMLTTLEGVCDGSQRLVTADFGDLPAVTTTFRAFNACPKLERVTMTTSPKLSITVSAFSGCGSLREIKGTIDLTSVTSTLGIFHGCSSLEEVRVKGLKADLDLSESAKLSVDSVKYLIDNLQQATGKSITLASAWQAAHPTEVRAYAQKATAKGFALTFR